MFLNFIYSILGTLLTPNGITFSRYGIFLVILVLCNIFGFMIMGMIATSSSFLTYKFGLDPDNFVIPILSSSADLITTFLLSLCLHIFF